MGLFKPAWQSENKKKALKAVEKTTEQTILADIAKNAKIMEVREAAVKMLDIQPILLYVAQNDEYLAVRTAAIKKLTDQNTLAEIVNNADN